MRKVEVSKVLLTNKNAKILQSIFIFLSFLLTFKYVSAIIISCHGRENEWLFHSNPTAECEIVRRENSFALFWVLSFWKWKVQCEFFSKWVTPLSWRLSFCQSNSFSSYRTAFAAQQSLSNDIGVKEFSQFSSEHENTPFVPSASSSSFLTKISPQSSSHSALSDAQLFSFHFFDSKYNFFSTISLLCLHYCVLLYNFVVVKKIRLKTLHRNRLRLIFVCSNKKFGLRSEFLVDDCLLECRQMSTTRAEDENYTISFWLMSFNFTALPLSSECRDVEVSGDSVRKKIEWKIIALTFIILLWCLHNFDIC